MGTYGGLPTTKLNFPGARRRKSSCLSCIEGYPENFSRAIIMCFGSESIPVMRGSSLLFLSHHRIIPSINAPLPQPGSRRVSSGSGGDFSNNFATMRSTTDGGVGTNPFMRISYPYLKDREY